MFLPTISQGDNEA